METTTESTTVVREVQIAASPETVWEFLVDAEKITRWKGERVEEFDPRPGGPFRIEIIPGHTASGEFVELDPPRRLVYTWGWESKPGSDERHAVPPGSSTIEVELVRIGNGTRLRFTHRDLPSAAEAESHAQGWDHYLERLVVVAAGGDPGPDPWASPDV